jgi:DNA repair exonuclease SbcCD ATPase subunit
MCRHSIITSIVKDITDLIQSLSRKSQMHSENFLQTGERGERNKNRKEKMNDKQQFQKLQKQIERNRSVAYIESIIMTMKQQKQVIKKKPDKVKMFLILVDYTEVKKSLKESVNKYLEELGRLLTDIAKTDLIEIQKEIDKYNMQLTKEADSIEEIKALLESITRIRNTSMDMELKISETQEQFRVLKMYKYPVDK